jgi:hypothetical protein
MRKPCEYCGTDLPLGVDKRTRQQRSYHFAGCERRIELKQAQMLDVDPVIDRRRALVERITSYLTCGGLWNPELAEHGAVRDLLIECRAALEE